MSGFSQIEMSTFAHSDRLPRSFSSIWGNQDIDSRVSEYLQVEIFLLITVPTNC